MLYKSRLNTLIKTYKRLDAENSEYLRAKDELSNTEKKLQRVNFLITLNKSLATKIQQKERDWRSNIIDVIQKEINHCLRLVFPDDNYNVVLKYKIFRNRLKIETTVTSNKLHEEIKIKRTQGRLFHQITSFAAMIAIMKIMGLNTIYIDEAFSGASEDNLAVIASLIESLSDLNINIRMIVQNEKLLTSNVTHFRLNRNTNNSVNIEEVCATNE